MLKRNFGWTSVEVPVIGQGTWMIEGGRETESRAVEALRLGLDLGMTHIDTAEMYGDGHEPAKAFAPGQISSGSASDAAPGHLKP